MGKQHLVKTGLMGLVGQYDAIDFRSYDRDTRVICRTERGLEAGIVICEINDATPPSQLPTGELLRQTGHEDLLILERLARHRDKAFFACQKLLRQRDISATLIDVEHLFDGESIFFYFLGEVTPELETITAQLADTYEQKIRFKKFVESLANGCGPDCGTENAGCASNECGSCVLSAGCGSTTRSSHPIEPNPTATS